jgi:hypothetical protein
VIARLLLVGALVTLVACASQSPNGSSGQVWEGEGVRFTAPPGWTLQAGGDASSEVLVYVTNQLGAACPNSASACPSPVAQLKPGSVLVAWSAHHCVAHGCDLPAGDQVLVGGRVAVRYPGPGFCRDLMATEEEVVIVTVTPQRVDRIVTCSRDPAPETTAALATMFDSIQWRTP